jgi:hypothetical protein
MCDERGSFTKSKEVNYFTLVSLFVKSDDIINFCILQSNMCDERGTLLVHFAIILPAKQKKANRAMYVMSLL